jgi:hypothetical protein
MRGIKRHIKRDDLLCFTIFFKIDWMVVLMAVEDKELIYALCMSFRWFLEMFYPI